MAVGYPANLSYAVFTVCFALAGWFFFSKRKPPVSNRNRGLVVVIAVLLGGFVILIAIPDFVRMEYKNSQDSCVNNLRQLQAAKVEWALENGKTNGTPVTANVLTPYIQLDSNGQIPQCPVGGTYVIGRVGEDVRCSIGTSDWPNRYVLSDTNDFTWWENFKGAYSILLGLRHPQKP